MSGQSVLVTDGADGIGFGVALELARAGSRVVIADRSLQKASDAAAEIRTVGFDAVALALDVMDEERITDCVQEIVERVSRINVLVNSAAIACEQSDQSAAQDLKPVLEASLFGSWRIIQALMPHFKVNGGGRIVNIAPVNGSRPWADAPGYAASKGALINLTQWLASNLWAANINVNAVCPGEVATSFPRPAEKDVPNTASQLIRSSVLNRVLQPEDIGRAVVFLASTQASNITGQSLNVDGGIIVS